jgi:hypothetical protein
MGERIKQEYEPAIKPANSSGKKSGDGNPDPRSSETKRGRGRPRKNPNENGATETEILPRVVVVDIPETEKEKSSVPESEEKKTKKPSVKKPAPKKIGLTKDNLSSILKSTFDVIGSRDGFEIWKLDQKECDQISDPLSKIVARSSYLEKITDEYGDYIALIIALSVVVAPRLLIQLKINKTKKEQNEINTKKEQKINDPKTRENRDQGNEIREIGSSDRRLNRSSPYASENIGDELHQLIGSF